jgi:hypothetical protein
MWRVYLMKLDKWGTGPFAKQTVGREVASTQVRAGATESFASPAAGPYRLVASNSDGTVVGVSDEILWDPAKGLPSPVVLVPGRTGKIIADLESGQVTGGELMATNTVIPESLIAAEHRLTDVTGDTAIVDKIPPGDYLLTLTSATFNANAVNVRVEAGRVTHVKLRPLDLGTIEGRVMVGRLPVTSATVTVKSQTDPNLLPKTAATNEAGMFRIEGLPADAYIVEASDGSGEQARTVRKSAIVPSQGGVVHVELNLEPPPRISFSLPPSFAVAPGTPIILLSRETGDTIHPQWRDGMLEANLMPGVYGVSVGDAPVGTIRIDADGYVEPVE